MTEEGILSSTSTHLVHLLFKQSRCYTAALTSILVRVHYKAAIYSGVTQNVPQKRSHVGVLHPTYRHTKLIQ